MAVRSIFIMALMGLTMIHHHTLEALSANTGGPSTGLRRERSVPVPEDLVKAVEEGDLGTVKDLLQEGVDVNYDSGAALSAAARLGHLEIAKTLLQSGAHPDGGPEVLDPDTSAWSKQGYPLFWAADKNNTDLVDLLLEAGAHVNAGRMMGGTIQGAAENGHVGIVKKFLDAGFDPDTGGGFALTEAIKAGHLDIVDAFIEAGINLNNKDDAILSGASDQGHLDIVEMMLEKGVDPTYGLRVAAAAGQLDVVRTLLEAGAKITYSDPKNPDESPLHQAIIQGHIDVIEALVEYGADINAPYGKDNYWDMYGDMGFHGAGWTVVHLASRWGFKSLLQKLVDLGADINAVDEKGYTPLHVAIINLKLEVVKELLMLCADWTLPDGLGETPLDLAKRTVSRDYSELTQSSGLLKDLATRLLKERVEYYPYTEDHMKELAKDLQDHIQANKTMMEKLDSQSPGPSWGFIQVATRRVFEEKAIAGLVEAFGAYGCKLTMGHHFHAPIGSQYLVKCECLPRKARKLTVKHLPKEVKCTSETTLQN